MRTIWKANMADMFSDLEALKNLEILESIERMERIERRGKRFVHPDRTYDSDCMDYLSLIPTMSEVDSESNKSADSWSTAKSKKRKQNMMEVETDKHTKPHFPPLKKALLAGSEEMRKIPVPPNRYTPLKENWLKIFTPVVEILNLNIRFNLRSRMVEIRTCNETKDIGSLQKAADFVRAFTLGFEVEDALALVRLDELYLESFDVKDVKTLHGDHLSRAIGRLVGKGGKTKYTIENATKTRIVVADSKIHILGSYQNIRAARTTLCNLILGSAPSKVYGTMRQLANRCSESI